MSSGAGGRDGGGVCAADAGGVGAAGAADSQWQAAAGGAGGGAGLPGAGAQPRRPRHRGPPTSVHAPGAAPLLCEYETALRAAVPPATCPSTGFPRGVAVLPLLWVHGTDKQV